MPQPLKCCGCGRKTVFVRNVLILREDRWWNFKKNRWETETRYEITDICMECEMSGKYTTKDLMTK